MFFLIYVLFFSIEWTYSNSETLDDTFSTPTHLSDKKMNEAKDFVHQGKRDQTYRDECQPKERCQDQGEGFPLESMIGKAYAMIGMISGGGITPTLNKKPTEAQITAAQEATIKAQAVNPQAKEVKPEKDKMTDYCMLAASAYETFGGMIQQALQKQADNTVGENDAQVQALINLKQTHEARQKTASFQSYVYGAVTLCYTGMMIAPKVATDWNLILKKSGSALLTGLYIRKALKHKNAAEDVGKVIASLESTGKNCDPWTKSTCFCSEATSKTRYPLEFEEVCVLNKGNFEKPKVALGCAALNGNQLQFDKDCKCKLTNSCLKSPLRNFHPDSALSANYMNEANKVFDLLGQGQYDQALLNRANLGYLAKAGNTNPKGLDKIRPNLPALSAEEKKLAEEFKQLIPAPMAQVAAQMTPSNHAGIPEPSLSENAINKLTPEIKEKLAQAISGQYRMRGGGGQKDQDGFEFNFPKITEDKTNSESNEILSFAEQATMKAEVSNRPSTPIFDIISNRYRLSGWQKLDTQGK